MASLDRSTISYAAPGVNRILDTNESVTGPIGLEMLLRSDLPSHSPSSPIHVLDNASGAGIIPNLILQLQEKNIIKGNVEITAADKDEMYINQLEARKANTPQESGWSTIQIKQFDMQEPPFEDDTFDAVFANMGIFFCQDDEKALKETLRILKPGGQAGFTSWVKIAWWSMALEAISQAYPSSPTLPDSNQLFSRGYNTIQSFKAKLEEAGYKDTKLDTYKFKVDIQAERFAEATSTLINMIIGKYWSQDDILNYGGKKIENAILDYLVKNYKEGKWDGEMEGIIALGRK